MTDQVPQALLEAGAVLADDGRAQGLPLHYGWPADEQQAFDEGRGFAFLGQVGIVEVTGADRLTWLTTLSSQIVSDLLPGVSKELLILDPQGRIEFAAGVIDDGESAWLITGMRHAHALAEFLDSMRFMLRVEVSDRSDDYAAFAANNLSASSPHIDVPDGTLVWQDPWPGVEEGGAAYFQGKHPQAAFSLYLVPAHRAQDFARGLRESGYTPVGLLAAEASRVAAWRPLISSEVDERTVPAELDWLRTAVHLSKGCYRGQESVARIINLGRPPRRLTFLQFDGSAEASPAVGDPVELDGRQVGVLTSFAQHYEMGPIGLAMLKRSLDPAAPLKVRGVDASQEEIVPVSGRSDHTPDQRPGAGLRRIDSDRGDIRTRGPRV